MGKYRKLPVVIEAVLFKRVQPESVDAIFEGGESQWLREAMAKRDVRVVDDHLLIRTKEGWIKGSAGDWIIRGVQGELYPCKPDIFAATYEPVE